MNNPNTLVALAYIKINDNPMQVFCNYILALLITAPDKTLRNDELIQKLEEKFGLRMTQTMINNCISIMRKSGEVARLPKSTGYSVKQTNFSVEEFEANMRRLHTQEDAVIRALVQFVKEKYNLSWDDDKAKGYLSSFLNERGNAARLFMNDPVIQDSVIHGMSGGL